MSHEENPMVVYVKTRCIRETPKALLIELGAPMEGEPKNFWLPKSQLSPDSDVRADGDEGELTVTKWWEDQQEWTKACLERTKAPKKRDSELGKPPPTGGSVATSVLPTLYDLTARMKALVQAIEETEIDEDGAVPADSVLLAELESAEVDFSEKLQNCVFVAQRFGEEAATMQAWADRFRLAAAAKKKRQDWLKDYVKMCMKDAGVKKAQAGPFALWIQKNPASLKVFDEGAVPAAYKDVVPEHLEVNKDALKKALEAEEELAGAMLINDKDHLRVGPVKKGDAK